MAEGMKIHEKCPESLDHCDSLSSLLILPNLELPSMRSFPEE